MTSRPRFKLSRLRELGWTRWDPTGLMGLENTPDDEYDSYLLHAVGRLWNHASEREVADYLVGVEKEDMGMGHRVDMRQRPLALASGLNDYVTELRG